MSRHPRKLAIAGVVVLHLAFIAILLTPIGIALAPRETTMVLVAGPVAQSAQAPKPPAMTAPDPVDASPPEIATTDTLTAPQVVTPSGSPNVTRPAVPLPDAHDFPPLVASTASGRSLRLLLSIAIDGRVIDASVAQSSGSEQSDRFAIAWVKQHWRYEPALQNGDPVPVTTLALVTFGNRSL